MSYPCRLNGRAIIATLPEVIKKNEEYEVYKSYITECLKAFGENKRITVSYYDLINPKPKDNRTAEEVAADVIKRAGLEVI